MKLKDVINLTLKNITYRKTRSFLTILGIIIGIASVVGLVSLGDVIQGSINVQLGGLGGDKLIITPGESQQSFSRGNDMNGPLTSRLITQTNGAKPLTEKEADAIARLPNIRAVSPMYQKQYEVVFRSEYSPITTQFVDPLGAEQTEDPELLNGRWLTNSDNTACVLGYNVAKDLFSYEIKVGETVKVNNHNCRVVGILKKEGGLTGMDNYIMISLNAVKSFTDEFDDELSIIRVRATDEGLVDEVEEEITNLLLRLHNTNEKDFTIISFATISEKIGSISIILSAFLGGIATISLLVGAIGISNTMLTSVMERTREIGILKAIGAKKNDILLMFIAESSIMSFIGGLIGLIVGLGLAQFIIFIMPIAFNTMPEQVANSLRLVINPLILIGSLIISVIIGVISGLLPAKQAAELNPIQAIWYE